MSILEEPVNPPTPNQPTLPAETQFTQAELVFMDESPPGLFPENQNSNFGYIIRKIFSDLAQDVANWQDTLYNEHFAETANLFLDQWEIEVDLPPNPSGSSLALRRQSVLARLQRGPFTRDRRDGVIESSIETTFGNPIQLVPEGVSITSAGIPIYGEASDVTTLFEVYENQQNFSYEVWIVSTSTPDIATLTRQLKRITPAGISFTIDNTHANILDYFRTVRSMAPIGYWRLGNLNDSSGNGITGTAVGGVTVGTVAAPGLLNAAIGGTDGATDFDGVDDSIQIPANTLFSTTRTATMVAWIQPDTLPAAGNNYKVILSSANETTYLTLSDAGNIAISAWIDGVQRTTGTSNRPIQAGQKYFVVGSWDGSILRLYVNNVLVTSTAYPPGAIMLASNILFIGKGTFGSPFDGKMDEAMVFNRALTAAEVAKLYNTGINVNV